MSLSAAQIFQGVFLILSKPCRLATKKTDRKTQRYKLLQDYLMRDEAYYFPATQNYFSPSTVVGMDKATAGYLLG